MFEIYNFVLNAPPSEVTEVFQRCVIISGRCISQSALEKNDSYVVVKIVDDGANFSASQGQHWPMCDGYFKALVLLSPGLNKVEVTSGADDNDMVQIPIRYTPLLQTPPLHLAIMIAKDSPLRIDCPPSKFRAISSTHSSLDATIAKFRIAAYMWQALTAEDLRSKGLGRRSFRLEEEWSYDTLSERSLHPGSKKVMNIVPRVHLIRTKKTLAELRDIQVAQQNPRPGGRQDELHQIFTKALQAHGPPFTADATPVVAGLILDSHYDPYSNIILGHAALGCHNSNGLSLGIFGSHLTYAWPRFLEEIPDCLLDITRPGESVGNDNNECNSMWEACAVGQGAFLHEVGHAFSAPHTTGIMQRGYSPDWPKAFLSRTAYSVTQNQKGVEPVHPDSPHGCVWDIRDAARFRNISQFWLPGDGALDTQAPVASLTDDEGGPKLKIVCKAGIVDVQFHQSGREDSEWQDKFGLPTQLKSFNYSITMLQLTRLELEEVFDPSKPVSLEITGLNGKGYSTKNIWNLFRHPTVIRIPGSNIRLSKLVVNTCGDEEQEEKSGKRKHDASNSLWNWGVMLKKRNRKGKLVRANMIDIRVGCALDGAIVYYKDGTKIPCGPRGSYGQADPDMGGHQHRKLKIPEGVDIVKVAVTRENGPGYTGWDYLLGLRIWLSNGKAMGALNLDAGGKVEVLVPPPNHKIIGFVGKSTGSAMCKSFGIVTAPVDVDLPESVYDIPELQNNPEGSPAGPAAKRRKVDAQLGHDDSHSNTTMQDDESDNSYGHEWVYEDDTYDDAWNTETEEIYQREK